MVKEYNLIPRNNELDIDMSDGNRNGQAVIKWSKISGAGSCPELRLFNDSWWMLPHLKDLFNYFEANNNNNLTPQDIIEELEKQGIKKASYCKA